MKRLWILLVALLLVVAVTPAAAQGQKLEIYIAGASENTLKWFREVAFPEFQKTHPDVTPDVITGTWGDFDTTVAGWITTGSGPDIVYLGSEYAATYGKLLADLDPYLKDWPDLAQYLPAAIATATYDGHLRGLPLLMSVRPTYYRTDLAADPSVIPPLTFADQLAFVKANSTVADGAITKMGFRDIDGVGFDAQEFIAYLWSDGGELYNADGTSTFDQQPTADALQFMYDRRRAEMPDETTKGLPPITGAPLASGSVVSGIFPMWNMPATTDPLWKDIVVAPYPAGPNGKPLVQVFIDWLSVPAYVKDPTTAVEFLKFIGSKENAIAMSSNDVAGFTPVRKDAWDDLKKDPVWAQILDVADKYGRGFSDIRASAVLRPLILTEAMKFMTDQQSLEDTQAALKEQYDEILKDNGYIQ